MYLSGHTRGGMIYLLAVPLGAGSFTLFFGHASKSGPYSLAMPREAISCTVFSGLPLRARYVRMCGLGNGIPWERSPEPFWDSVPISKGNTLDQ
jgi:hypothetical protein